MTKKKLFFSVVLLGAILAYLKFVEFPAEEKDFAKDKIFHGVDSTEIDTVRIVNGEETVSLVNLFPHAKPKAPAPEEGEMESKEPEQANWKLQNLPNAILDTARVNSLTSSIETLQSEATIPNKDVESDLGVYGLKPAALTLEISAKGAKRKLEFGKLNDFVGKRYLRVDEGADLFMVNNSLFDAASKKESEFRDKTPIAFAEDSISEFKVWSPAGEFTLLKKGDDWRVQNPDVMASSSVVYELFRKLRNLEASSFIDNKEKERHLFGLSAPQVRYSLSRKDKVSDLIEIGTAGGKYYLQLNSSGTIYELSKDPSMQLPVSVVAFREKKFLGVDSYLVNRIKVVRSDGKSFLLTKKDEKWSIDGSPADEPFIKEYLTSLETLTAIEFPSDATKINKVALKLEIESKNVKEVDGKPTLRTLIIGDEGTKGFLANIEGVPEVYLVSKEAVSKLNANSERFVIGSQPSSS